MAYVLNGLMQSNTCHAKKTPTLVPPYMDAIYGLMAQCFVPRPRLGLAGGTKVLPDQHSDGGGLIDDGGPPWDDLACGGILTEVTDSCKHQEAREL